MMKNYYLEIGVGLFILLGFIALFMLAMQVSNLSNFDLEPGYTVSASFENIGSLKVRAPVTAGGVRVGRVTSIQYNSDTYQADVKIHINRQYGQFPKDTSASIMTAGLLGEQYIGLEPGAEAEHLQNGDQIYITESALILERLVGQFLYNKAAGD